MFGDDIAREIPCVGGGRAAGDVDFDDDDDDVISVDGDLRYPPDFVPGRMASRQEQHPPMMLAGLCVVYRKGEGGRQGTSRWDLKMREEARRYDVSYYV